MLSLQDVLPLIWAISAATIGYYGLRSFWASQQAETVPQWLRLKYRLSIGDTLDLLELAERIDALDSQSPAPEIIICEYPITVAAAFTDWAKQAPEPPRSGLGAA